MRDMVEVMAESPKVFDTVNAVYGAITAVLVFLFGEHYILFAGFLVLNIVDFGTGSYKARQKKEVSSATGFKGAFRKVSYWIVIAIAFFISKSFIEMGEVIGVRLDFMALFGWLTLAMYLVNEIRSILENLVEIGVEVPFFLIKGLDITKKLIDAEADSSEEGMDVKDNQQ